jgi:hypothetical protein
LERFFGRINYYFAESEEADSLQRFHLSRNELHETGFKPGFEGSLPAATTVHTINQ